jgi:hypothetical protein
LNNAAGRVILTVASNITVNSAKAIVSNIFGGAVLSSMKNMLSSKVRTGGYRNRNVYSMLY